MQYGHFGIASRWASATSGFFNLNLHNVSRGSWRKFPGNKNGNINGLKRDLNNNFRIFATASLCGSLSHFSTMTTPAKVRKVAIYRAAGMWDGYGPLQREPEPISYPLMCPIPVPSSLFSGNTYSRAGLASTAAFRRHISSHRHKPLRSIPLLSRHR